MKKMMKEEDEERGTDAGVEEKEASDEDAVYVVHERERQDRSKLHGPGDKDVW
jgi:hypothetical protein